MSPELHAGLVRGLGLFVPLLLFTGLCLWRAPRRRETAAVIVASAWSLLTLVPLNLYAPHTGWWTFHTDGAEWRGIPLDLLLAWVVLWGALPALLLRLLPVPLLAGLLVWIDVILMPLADPVIDLGTFWLAGELTGATVTLIPALLLAYWTRNGQLVHARVWTQATLAGGLMVALPILVLGPEVPSGPEALAGAQLLLLAGLPGLAAAREFARVGGGTPLPYDPPERLVTSGPYAFVRNPMQTSLVVVHLLLAVLLREPLVLLLAVSAAVYSVGVAAWHEGAQLRERFGADWTAYRSRVRPWLPRWRPWPGRTRGVLHVDANCALCLTLARWFTVRSPIALDIRPAAEHPDVLYRLTYETPDGLRWSGVSALARALEHLNLGWALTGWAIDLPGVRHLVQLCGDAFGAGPHPARAPRADRGGSELPAPA
ncbi:isoprenylcysteine carboxylmethyltransferase family protein [Nocardiopsis sp. EMB25]|uniref:methyltransferase family protein n=1 Tax=Nocardiopsis sp. EMB25 TaxID=2835867 RepID=UPI002284744F|nr:methyltransferase [Nocardiopsis sp. EMB25]MCY9787599.1 isoprenylcysteine carboxylmethyltransferase family protein [Nocardiopsis sp. EMB25]